MNKEIEIFREHLKRLDIYMNGGINGDNCFEALVYPMHQRNHRIIISITFYDDKVVIKGSEFQSFEPSDLSYNIINELNNQYKIFAFFIRFNEFELETTINFEREFVPERIIHRLFMLCDLVEETYEKIKSSCLYMHR